MTLSASPQIGWKELVAEALTELGGEGHLSDINSLVDGHPKTARNPTWRDTIRRVVRQYGVFEPVPPERSGRYRLIEQAPRAPREVELSSEDPTVGHAEAQGMLVTLGRLCGYDTYVPKADQTSRSFQGESLSSLVTVRDCSDVFRGASARSSKLVDVLWLADDDEGLFPRYAFEVEHSTDVKSGMVRLIGIPQRYAVPLYVVGPDAARPKFDRYIAQDPFRSYSDRLRFRSYEALEDLYNTSVRHDVLRLAFGVQARGIRE